MEEGPGAMWALGADQWLHRLEGGAGCWDGLSLAPHQAPGGVQPAPGPSSLYFTLVAPAPSSCCPSCCTGGGYPGLSDSLQVGQSTAGTLPFARSGQGPGQTGSFHSRRAQHALTQGCPHALSTS